MKIQYYADQVFSLVGKNAKVGFNPNDKCNMDFDFVCFNDGKIEYSGTTKKQLCLPGEFEISNVLVKGFYTDDAENIVYKVVMENCTFAHFGSLKTLPNKDLFEKLGENIDIAFFPLSADFEGKLMKELIEKVEPRIAILCGDSGHFPKMMEIMGAKMAEENPLTVSKSKLADDKTEVLILPV